MSYKVYLSTKVKPKDLKAGTGVMVLEPGDYTAEEIAKIRGKGYKVLAYLSVGSLERERSWFEEFDEFKLKRLGDWPNEYYMDVTKTKWRKFLKNRAADLKEKGFDGWWLDNIDVYSEYKSKKMFTAIGAVFLKLREIGGYVMINGGSEWLDDAMDRGEKIKKFVHGYTQEEVFSRILDYSGKGGFGRQNKEDSKYYRTLMKKTMKKGVKGFCLEYTRDDELKKKIKAWCKKYGARYCISEDVDL